MEVINLYDKQVGGGRSRAGMKLQSRVPENGKARKILGAKGKEKEGRWQTQGLS